MSDWQMGLIAFREGRMLEAADRLLVSVAEQELTFSQAARFETYIYLGAALYTLGRPEEASHAFETAFRLSLTPVPPSELMLNLAHAYLAAGRRDAAREALLHLLKFAPGHITARMLLQRLQTLPDGEPITGMILGESAESVKRYLRTLNFATVSLGGYDPVQVRVALSQLESYLETLDKRIQADQETIIHYETEFERYREMEDTMIQNFVETQRETQDSPAAPETVQLSPIELLFQKKQ